jgi:WD40 repeat protein
MMRMKYVGLLGVVIAALLVMACGDGSAHYPEEDGIPNNCEYKTGEHYQPTHFARFDNNNHRLMLVDWNTGEDIFELDTNINASRTSVLEWSPNCQYLITTQDGSGVLYDVVNGKRLAGFDKLRGYSRYNPSVVFDQTNTYFTAEAGGTTYLHKILTGETFPLVEDYFRVQFFDMTRGQLVGIGDTVTSAFDLNNGAKIADFYDLNLTRNAHMVVSPDGTTLAFTSDNRWTHVINRDTMNRIDLNMGFYSYDRETTMALSQDNRYLAIGATRVNVWDLQNLQPIVGDRMPTAFNFPGPGSFITDIHFVEGNIIETETYTSVSYWDMTTGEEIVR